MRPEVLQETAADVRLRDSSFRVTNLEVINREEGNAVDVCFVPGAAFWIRQ